MQIRRLTIVTLFAALAGVSAFAGEAIIVPAEKAKNPSPQAPGQGKATPQEVFRLRDRTTSPFDVMTVPMLPSKSAPLDPKEEKKRKLQELERKNWMVVGQGELQAEEEAKNFLDVRDYSLDDLEKQDGTGNLMFRQLNKDDNRRMPGQFRSSGDNTRQPAQRNASNETSEDTGETRGVPESDKLGAHMSRELNFKGLFEPRQGGDSLAPKFNKSDLTLHSLLNSGASPETSREQQARREEFRNFLNGPKGVAAPLAGPGDPINARSDFTRLPVNPTMPQPFGSGDTAAKLGGATFAPPNLNRAGAAPGLAGFDLPRASGGFNPAPVLTPQEPARNLQKQPFTFDPPKRKF